MLRAAFGATHRTQPYRHALLGFVYQNSQILLLLNVDHSIVTHILDINSKHT